MNSKNIILLLLVLSTFAFGANADSAIYGKDLLTNILGYDQKESLHLGYYFTVLQSTYFKPLSCVFDTLFNYRPNDFFS